MKNEDDLKILLDDLHFKNRDIDIIMLCETFLSSKNKMLAENEGYQSLHVCREDRLGGGVSIFIRNGIKYKKTIIGYAGQVSECLLAEVEINHKTLLVGSLYQIPNTPLGDFLADVKSLLRKTKRYHNVIIGSDQNLDLLKVSQHDVTSKFCELLTEFELFPTINKPTRVTHQTASLIDNLYLKCNLKEKFESFVICDGMSNHYPCLVSIITHEVESKISFETRDFSEENLQKINQCLLFEDWSVMRNMNVDESAVYLRDQIVAALGQICP